MKYDAPQVDRLAAEYVLGTLQASARRRFEKLITERADARFAVWRWERFLNDFASGLVPRKPRRRVWKNIQRRISSSPQSGRETLGWWRGLRLAVPTAVAAAWLAVVLVSTPSAERMAIFADQGAETLWVISANLDKGSLLARAINAPGLASENSFELWVLPAEGPPLSLGLLNVAPGSVATRISARLTTALKNAESLAISLEPVGGSPTGLPTGPIIYQASLVII